MSWSWVDTRFQQCLVGNSSMSSCEHRRTRHQLVSIPPQKADERWSRILIARSICGSKGSESRRILVFLYGTSSEQSEFSHGPVGVTTNNQSAKVCGKPNRHFMMLKTMSQCVEFPVVERFCMELKPREHYFRSLLDLADERSNDEALYDYHRQCQAHSFSLAS